MGSQTRTFVQQECWHKLTACGYPNPPPNEEVATAASSKLVGSRIILPSSQVQPRINRSLQLALFATSITWVIAANLLAGRAARGLAVRLRLSDEFLLLNAVFLVFLLVIGFALLQGIVARGTSLRRTIGLPRRPTSLSEWATGAAIGWSVILVAVLPPALTGSLHVRFWLDPRAWWLAGLNLATIAVLAMAAEIAFRGYPFRRLIDAIGPAWATIVISVVYGISATINQNSTYLSLLIAVAFSALLCTAWLRTHALWLGWGLHFAWIASLGVLFGLPVTGLPLASTDNLSSIIETRAIGAFWLTGGDLGPEGALVTPLLLFAAIVAVILVSRDWAWNYTRKPLIAAGYPVDVPPPAAHEEMERQIPAATPALVQILPSTPQTRSVQSEP